MLIREDSSGNAFEDNYDVVIAGGGIGALSAAYLLVTNGLKVLLLEQDNALGGIVSSGYLDGMKVDLGAECFAARSKPVVELCNHLHLDYYMPTGRSSIWDEHDGMTRLPYGVLGIPADLGEDSVQKIISPAGIERAREDLTMGPEVGADAKDLDTLVRTRLGDEIADKLVVPIAGGIHSTHPRNLSPDSVIPGLSLTLAEKGSLVLAARALRKGGPAGNPVYQPVGGMHKLVDNLVEFLQARGAVLLVNHKVSKITKNESGWTVQVQKCEPNSTLAKTPVNADSTVTVNAKRAIIACDVTGALPLLEGIGELDFEPWTMPKASPIVHMNMMVRSKGLNSFPLGSGILINPTDKVKAKALIHINAKWASLRDMCPPDVHVMRLSYGREYEPHPNVDIDLAVRDAEVLSGAKIDGVIDYTQVHWAATLRPLTPEHRQKVALLQEKVQSLSGLGLTGAWVAGTGIGTVVPHALATARRLSALL